MAKKFRIKLPTLNIITKNAFSVLENSSKRSSSSDNDNDKQNEDIDGLTSADNDDKVKTPNLGEIGILFKN